MFDVPIRTALLMCNVAIAALIPCPAEARIFSPRVVSQHTADAYSMRTFAEFHRWKDLEGDARAWAVYEYLTDRRTGLYPLGMPAYEGPDKTYEHSIVRDPVKMINVYSTGFCAAFGPVMEGVWEDAGFGAARTVDLPGFSHVVCEVEYDGGWHYLDLDLRGAFRRPDGSLASFAEAQRDESAWQSESSARFFPLDDLKQLRAAYAKTDARHRYGAHESGHTMDFVLRQGETFTRWWKPQGGRWSHDERYHKEPFFKKLFETEPRGPKPKHPSFTEHTDGYGNGRFVYAPNLKAGSSDFADGADEFENVIPGKDGLTLQKAGEGYAVFEVRSPYVIVPVVGNMAKTDDDREASVIEIDAAGAAVEISRDNAATWEPIAVKKWPATIDVTKQSAGRYGYLLKIVLKGKPGGAVVKSLKVTTWVQLAPASLPALRQGRNEMELKANDHYGLPTRIVAITPDASNVTEFSKTLIVPPKEYDPKSPSSRLQGPFVVRAAAPAGTKIAWFSAGGSFQTRVPPDEGPSRTSMAYAVGSPVEFQEFWRADVPSDQSHWHYSAAREVRLEEPAETVYVRFDSDRAVNNIRIYAHCLDDRPRANSRVQVTHRWSEAGEAKEFTTAPDETGRYEIEVEGESVNESIDLSVPSDS